MSEIQLRPCPNCYGMEYKYAKIYDELIETLSNANYKRMAYGVVAHSHIAIVAGAAAGLRGDYKTSPLLECKECHISVVMCPECEKYLIFDNDHPSAKTVYACHNCQKHFKLISSNYNWSVAIGHNDAFQKGLHATVGVMDKVDVGINIFATKIEKWLNTRKKH